MKGRATWKGVTLVMLLSLLAVSCARYSVAVSNGTEEDLTDVSVSWSGYTSRFGYLGAGGGGKVEAWPDAPFPKVAVVGWKTADGVRHEQDVDISKSTRGQRVSKDVDVEFTITQDGVEVALRRSP